MGLDTVELVMAIEEEFSIEIANGEAANLAVLGEMHNYILKALRQRGESPDPAELWERLKAIVIDQLGVLPKDVVPSAHVIRDLGAD
jgi:acyl carrier protein